MRSAAFLQKRTVCRCKLTKPIKKPRRINYFRNIKLTLQTCALEPATQLRLQAVALGGFRMLAAVLLPEVLRPFFLYLFAVFFLG